MKRLLGLVIIVALLYAGVVGYRDGSGSPAKAGSGCDPNYAGACLDPNAPDYDCTGGSGNGPDYTGEVTVLGNDHFGLDADGDHRGCEAY